MRGINSISIIVICIMLAGCKADMICPAYQSYFILDELAEKDQFTYFALDSLPRRDIFSTSKDQNGLVAKSGLLAYVDADWQRNLDIRTINMEVIYPQISDSILFAGDAMMFAETDVVDTVALDSARMAAQSFRYGADQKFYNWYFRDKLVWKDELNKSQEETGLSSPQPTETEPDLGAEKKGLGGLFKKKEKQPKEPKQKRVKTKKERKVEEPILENEPTQPIPPAQKEEEDDGEDDF